MSWTSETNIKGPKGDKGDQGIPGPPGASGAGTGNVTGPAGAVADRIAVYNGTSGTVIKDGGKLISELATTASVPAPATVVPPIESGSGAVGTSVKYAREDHAHPLAAGGTASSVTVAPAGNISSTNVQAALQELDTEKEPVIAGGTTSQFWRGDKTWQVPPGGGGGAASGITFAPAGTHLVATNVQAAIVELDAEKLPIDGSLDMTGDLWVTKANPMLALMKSASGQGSRIGGYFGNAARWSISLGDVTAETGSGNTGSNFGLYRYNDAGTLLANALTISRADGTATLTGPLILAADPNAALGATTKQYVDSKTKKNYVVNGAMMVSQENGSTAGTTNVYYAVDQFYGNFSNAGACSAVQLAVPALSGSPNRFRFIVTTADTSVTPGDLASLVTRIEGLRVADLQFGTVSAKTITIQFGVYSTIAGTFCVTVLNGVADRSYVAEYVIAAGEAGTSVVKSVTIPGDTTGTWAKDTTAGLEIRWALMAGTTYQKTAGTWGAGNMVGSANQANLYAAVNNQFQLFDVGLYEGTTAPPFQVPDFADELAACQRYWEKTSSYPVAAVSNNAGAGGVLACSVVSTTANTTGVSWTYKTQKRANGTILTFNPYGVGSGFSQSGSSDIAATVAAISENNVYLRAAASTIGATLTITASCNARLP